MLDEQNIKIAKYKNLLNKLNPNILETVENDIKLNSFTSYDISKENSKEFIESVIKKIDINKLLQINQEFELIKHTYEEKKNSEAINSNGQITKKWISNYETYQKLNTNIITPFQTIKEKIENSDFSINIKNEQNQEKIELIPFHETEKKYKLNLRKFYLIIFILLWILIACDIFFAVYEEIISLF